MMNWRIPVSILGTVFVFSGMLYLIDNQGYPSPMFMLFSGGLMLGAVFMASDMVASPITPLGIWIYGGLIGLLSRSDSDLGRFTRRSDVCDFIRQMLFLHILTMRSGQEFMELQKV